MPWRFSPLFNPERAPASIEPKQFLEHTVAKGSVLEISFLLLVCAEYGGNGLRDQRLTAVDRLVIGDDAKLCTLYGLECAIFLRKVYLQRSNVAKAFLETRKALGAAELIGLHRRRETAAEEKIWWSLYIFDRFCSLTLGVPYGIADDKCDLRCRGRVQETKDLRAFTLGLAQLEPGGACKRSFAGKRRAEFRVFAARDEEMVRLARDMPKEF